MKLKRRSGVPIAVLCSAVLLLAACSSSKSHAGSSSAGSTTPGGSSSAGSVTSLRMQLSWLPSAQFAGYLAAVDQGFYKDAGLDVKIVPGGPNTNDIQQLVSGAADITVDRTSTLFSSIDKGIPLKAVAEFDSQSGFWLVAKKSTGITKPSDLKGKRIGIFSDDEFEYDAMLSKMGLDPKKDVHTFFEGFTMDPFLQNQFPVAMVTSWDELQTLYEAGLTPDQLTFFKPTDFGVGVLHGALIANQSYLSAHTDAVKAFVKATIKGWAWAYANPTQAVQIVLKAAPKGDSAKHETDQLNAMKQIQWPNGTQPSNWGQIPMDTYTANAQLVKQFGVVKKDVDVSAAVDTTIAGS